MRADLTSTIPEPRSRRAVSSAPIDDPAGDGHLDIAHFAVTKLLGSGGMGVVFEARDLVLDRRVALKLLRVEKPILTQGRARHLREAQALARLDHPNIVRVFEAGVADGECFIAMELVDGPTLQHWMREPHDWRAVVDVFVQVGRGLAHAHAHGLVHRDIKPSNILIDRCGVPKLGDFGLVTGTGDLALGTGPAVGDHVLARATTTAGHVMGTPAYMAPEQKFGEPADPRSDQYAFCASLHEALTGVLPSESRSGMFGLPRALQRIVERGLAVEPYERFPTTLALVAALEATRRTPIQRLISLSRSR